ncbi:MAG: spore protease YyaC [Bacillota bacterium]
MQELRLTQIRERDERRVWVDDPLASSLLGSLIVRTAQRLRPGRSICPVIVCIGTDRSTGDSLGPLVGTFLTDGTGLPLAVYGTLDQPIHASNLAEKLPKIEASHPGALVMAVDACLGSQESVGSVAVGNGPLRPGAGVNKVLPPVGEISITGVVNVGGFMEYFVLQNTRLSLVVRMSRVIADACRVAARELAGRSPFN